MRLIKYDPAEKVNAASAIATILSVPSSDKALTLADVRMGVRVLDKIDAADGELALEEAEFSFVSQRIEVANFAFVDRNLIGALEAVLAAQETKGGK